MLWDRRTRRAGRLRGALALATGALLAALLVLAALPALAQEQAPKVEHSRLPNGLDIYVYEDHTAPLVSVNLWYRVGSRDEPVGLRGMAHLMEHMMFKGSTRVGPEQHARLIQAAGGISNAFTTTDATVYWEKVPSSQLELALALEAERMAHLAITPEKLASEREVVKEEYRARLQNDPIGVAFDRFHSFMFEGTPYAWTPAGFLDDLDRITVNDLDRFYRTHYVPSNAVLVVAGDTTLAEVERLARIHFGPIPPGEVPERQAIRFAAPALGQPRREQLALPVQVPGVLAGFAVPGARSEDRYALAVASSILSGGESARLYQRLVKERQLAVYAGGAPLDYAHAGAFLGISFFLPPHTPEQEVEALLAEIGRLADEPPTPEELAAARNQVAAAMAFQMDSLDGVAGLIGGAVVVEGDLGAFTRGIEPYLQVSAQDVQRVARRYLQPAHATVVTLVPAQGGAARP
ncbi:pitrilysin family protein [Carboxydochorda subterranea]|uniref:Pitrilysin family protein n=1 Tax=Carboxydichorda subterranea TaxID=3109565 RepID=A0ABZ1BVK5_9FIRM|nr:pitrilysin family protein [Limnochorda sp. L945t]WRP16827.1 pitrilysin family protein [Limnochorda sp. L945t]